MPAFSGLWDGIHGEAYADMVKADARPPVARGIIRVMMQKRGLHGHVNALGRNAPADIARINADRGDINVRGGYDYANRQDDPANEVVLENVESHALLANVAPVTEVIARVPDATEADLAHTYDTTLRNGHPADVAGSGATSPAVDEVISDGT